MVENWVKSLVEDVIGGSPLQIGKHYLHPTDGVIVVTSGQYWGTRGLSNFWYWTVLATGDTHSGYGGEWEEVSHE